MIQRNYLVVFAAVFAVRARAQVVVVRSPVVLLMRIPVVVWDRVVCADSLDRVLRLGTGSGCGGAVSD